MSQPPVEPLFLARQSYRRRRLGDAARLLPLLGTIMFLLPVMWSDAASTAGGIVYIFLIWALLIVVMSVIARKLALPPDDAPQDSATPGD